MADNKRGQDGEAGGRRCLFYSVEVGKLVIWGGRVDTACSFP